MNKVIEIPLKIHNNFQIVKRNTVTGKENRYKAENIVLDQFYALVNTANPQSSFIASSGGVAGVGGVIASFVQGVVLGIGGGFGAYRIMSNNIAVLQLTLRNAYTTQPRVTIRQITGTNNAELILHTNNVGNPSSTVDGTNTIARLEFSNVAGQDNIASMLSALEANPQPLFNLTQVAVQVDGTSIITAVSNIVIVGGSNEQLDLTRTTLFNRISAVRPINPEAGLTENPDGFFIQNEEEPFSMEMVCRIRNDQANGVLTEIGLLGGVTGWSSSNWHGTNSTHTNSFHPVTHALITDAEDNPTSILKTDEETLEIRARIFGEFTTSGDDISQPEDAGQMTNSPIPTPINRRCGFKEVAIGASAIRTPGTSPFTSGQFKIAAYRHKLFNHAFDRTVIDTRPQIAPRVFGPGNTSSPHAIMTDGANFRTRQTYTFFAADQNIVGETYPIKSIDWGGLFMLQFPNEDFGRQPAPILFENVASGTTDFSHNVWGLNTDDVEIRVNGTPRAPDNYKFTARNLDFAASWESGWTERMVPGEISCATTSTTTSPRCMILDFTVQATTGTAGSVARALDTEPSIGIERPALWDYGRPKKIDLLRFRSNTTNNIKKVRIECSDDNNTWRAVSQALTRAETIDTAGAVNAYTVTPETPITAYQAGMRFRVRFHLANTSTAVNVNVSGLGNLTVRTEAATNVPAGAITAGSEWDIVHNGINWTLQPITDTDIILPNVALTAPAILRVQSDEARYWRAEIITGTNNETWYLLMDEDHPWLRFNTPISAGSTVEVRATTSYPIKNEKKQFIISADIVLTRG